MASPDRFESLIAPYLGSLYRTAYRLARNVHDAEDLVQETCVRACENLTSLAACEHPDRWLVRVLYNLFLDGTRRRKRAPVVPISSVAELPAATRRVEDPADELARERAFQDACAQLGDAQRALLTLRAEGYGLAEIEDITGIGREVLRARLHRARRSLARHLEHQPDETDALSRLGSGQ